MQLSRALLTVITLVLVSCSEGDETTVQTPPPPSVTVSEPELRQITDWDEFTARLGAVEFVEVKARVSGYLTSVEFQDGALIEEGQLLFVIDPRPFEEALAQARAELREKTVSEQLAANDLARAATLFESRAISEEEFDARTQNVDVAQAQVAAAQARVRQSELDLEFTEVRSPISGRVSRTLVTRGNLVSGGVATGTLLTTVVRTDPIYAYFTASEETFLRYVRMDLTGERESSRSARNPIRLKISDEDGYVHAGVIDFVDNVVDRSTGTIEGRAILDNADGLLIPGLFARLQLKGKGPYEALLIPDIAIGTDQAEKFVYVVGDDNTARRRTVSLGRLTQDGMRVIQQGLDARSQVVINGLQRVRPGTPVAITPASDAL